MGWGYGWAPYVPVAERRRKAQRTVEKMKNKGQKISPVTIAGRTIAQTFWGKSWCENLEAYSDYANRLPRGRTYVRNGSVMDLQLREGRVEALVSGSDLYTVKINVTPLKPAVWKMIQKECAGKITSLVDLLQGRLSGAVMEIVTRRQTGLFPMPHEMSFNCSCPDWASMCKHVAAVLYGIGARLDSAPELLFHLRGVDHGDMICIQPSIQVMSDGVKEKIIAEDQLSDIFGIDIDAGEQQAQPPAKKRTGRPKTSPEQKKTAQEIKGKKTPKAQAKAKTKTAAKKAVTKKTQQRPEAVAPPVKKRVKVTQKKAGKKASKQPPKAAAKTTKKKIAAKPKPVRGQVPVRGKMKTKPKGN